jgi:ribosomal protein S7
MVTPTPTEQVKHQIRQIVSKAFKQMRGKVSDDQWKEFEAFFWKVRPLVEIDYSKFGGNINAETTGPRPTEKPSDEFIPSPVPDDTFKPGVL